MISAKNIATAVYRLADEEGEDAGVLGQKFFRFLETNNLQAQARQILYYIEQEYKKEKDKNTLFIWFAVLMENNGIVEQIKNFVKAPRSALVQVKEDKNIIGGFIALWQGEIYDASIRANLDRLKQALLA
jgi:F0F1-type ATP synthase delta subunit